MTRRRILAATLLLLFPGCSEEQPGPARQAATEESSLEPQRKAPLPGPPRTEVVGARFLFGLAVVGGLTADGKASAQVDRYDFPTDEWSSLPPLPVPLHHAGAGQLGDRLFVVGGYTDGALGPWTPTADVWSYGDGETAWRKEPPLSSPRGALAVASAPDRLVAVGGVAGPDLVRTEILEIGAAGWTRGPDLTTPREHLAATYAGGRIYAVAGRAGTLESNRDSVESWAPGEAAWRAEPKLNHSRGGIGAHTPGQGRPGFGSSDGRPCVAGGEAPGDRTIAEVECLTADGWKVVGRLEVPRHGLAVVSVDHNLHVIGGGPKPGLHVSDVHEMIAF